MLFVDRAKLDLAVQAFIDMAKTASPAQSPPISTEKSLSDERLIARHLVSMVAIICANGDGVSVSANDTEWVVGPTHIGAGGVKHYADH